MADLQSEAAAIAVLAENAAAGRVHEINDVPLIVLPGGQMVSLESLQDYPCRAKAKVSLDTIAALLDYLRDQRAATHHPVVFANRSTCTFTAFVDYHSDGSGRWLDHSAAVALKVSKEYETWVNSTGRWKSQVEMAEFLDDNLADIHTPTPADVLTFVEKLEATRKETFKSAINQATGEVAYTYSKENQSGNEKLVILSEFTLGIPFFHRGAPIQVKAKLQHSIREGNDGKAVLQFRFKVQNPEQIKDKLWDEMLAALRLALAEMTPPVPLFEGAAPSAPEPVRL